MEEKYKNLIKVAHYYYDLGMKQQEIADLCGVSRKTVNVMLKKAVDEGIVKITVEIVGYAGSDVELELELKDRLKLQDVVVVKNLGGTESFHKSVTQYLDKMLYDDINVGVNYGSTLSKLCADLHPSCKHKINVVQLGGGANISSITYRSEEITLMFASAYNGKAYNLYMPNIVDSKILKDMLSEETTFQEIFGLYKKLDAIVVAVGTIQRSDILLTEGYISEEEHKKIEEKSAVCDICFRFLDINGDIVDHELEERVTGISTEDLKKVPIRLCVSYGKDKVIPIISAVKGHFINRLITDRDTAAMILECLNTEK